MTQLTHLCLFYQIGRVGNTVHQTGFFNVHGVARIIHKIIEMIQ